MLLFRRGARLLLRAGRAWAAPEAAGALGLAPGGLGIGTAAALGEVIVAAAAAAAWQRSLGSRAARGQSSVSVSEFTRSSATHGSRPRGAKYSPKPLDPDVQRFLAALGVDTGALLAALPQRAPQLVLEEVRAPWALLEGWGVPDPAALLAKVPLYLTVDVETNLRPKLAALGVRGEALQRLLGSHPMLAYTTLETLEATLGRVQHFISAAAAEKLLPTASLPAVMATHPGLWGSSLCYTAAKVDGAFAALQSDVALTEAQFGAVLAVYPGVLSCTKANLSAKCAALAEVLGGKDEARLLILAAPTILWISPATLRANTAYLRRDLGWAAAEVAQYVQQQPHMFRRDLAAPAMQWVLQQCQAVLGLPPRTMLRQHASSLRCSPAAAVVRMAFVGSRGLQQRMLSKTAFLQESPARWQQRLQGWDIPAGDFAAFEAAFWRSHEGGALRQRMDKMAGGKTAAVLAAQSTAAVARMAGVAAGTAVERRGSKGKRGGQ